jgi:hypothetical protein
MMTYYRLALQERPSTPLAWKSTVLTSLDALLQHLVRIRDLVPLDRVQVFIASSKEDLDELLNCENNGLPSGSITGAQLLRDNMHTLERVPSTSADRRAENTAQQPDTVATSSSLLEYITTTALALSSGCSISMLKKKRLEGELGPGGDHDTPYLFSLPISTPQLLAWVRLLAAVQTGELQP